VSVSGRNVPRASRPFVTTPYVARDGKIEPVIPLRGPCWTRATPCEIKLHDRRKRKTGPPWGWIAVARCATHSFTFTLYPPGQVPYGRSAWVDLAPDGSELGLDPSEDEPEAAPEFTAAADAAAGTRWPRDSAPEPPGAVRSTQRRRVARAATLLGLAPDAPVGRETVAAVSGLAAGELVEVADCLAASSDLTVWGREVTALLAALARRSGRALMDRIAVLGHLSGWWGRPFRWAPPRGQLLELGRSFWTDKQPGTACPAGATKPSQLFHDFGPRVPP